MLMADIRDPELFMRGRWAWNAYGYEHGFPRKCAFTDVDAVVEFNGRILFIESKYHDGIGPCDYPSTGQIILLRRLRELPGSSVFVVYGQADMNRPVALRRIGRTKRYDVFLDWRHLPTDERRRLLKHEIDVAMGLGGIDGASVGSA